MEPDAEPGVKDDEAVRKDEVDSTEEKPAVPDEVTPQEEGEKKKAKKKRLKAFYKSLCQQMEFYFSDSNLHREGFLKKEMEKSADGWVDLKIFLTFNKIKEITEDINALAHSLLKSEMLEVDSTAMRVRRTTPFQEPKDMDERTVYVENLPKEVTQNWLRQKFSPYGSIQYISIPRFKSTKDPKGFAFIEFASVEAAAAAVEKLSNPNPQKKPGWFPKSNKTLEYYRRRTGAVGAAAEDAIVKEKPRGKGNRQSISSEDASSKCPTNNVDSSSKTEEMDADTDVNARLKSEEGMDSDRKAKVGGSSTNSGKKRKSSHVEGEGEGVSSKKQKTSQVEGEAEGGSTKKRKGSMAEGDRDAALARKGKSNNTEDEGEGGVARKRKGSHLGGDEESALSKKQRSRSLSVPAVSDGDSPDEPFGPERRKSDPGKVSAEDEKPEGKTKKKKKKKKKNKHAAVDGQKAQEEEASKTTTVEEKVFSSDGGSGAPVGRGEKKKRKHTDTEVSPVAPKILKSAISGEKSDKPPKRVTILTDPPKEFGGREKENKKTEDGEPEKKKTRRKKKAPWEKKNPIRLHVMPKKKWLQLREEYREEQKKRMLALKNTLKKLSKEEEEVVPSRHEKELTFTPGVIISMKCPDPISRKKILNDVGSEVEVAYVDIKQGEVEGFIRCQNSASAEKILGKSEALPHYGFSLLDGEKEQAYWQKIQVERAEKYKHKAKQGGKKKLVEKVKKMNVLAAKKQHIIFDED